MALSDTAKLIAALELQDKFSATAAKYDRTIAGMEKRTSSLSRISGEVGRGSREAITNVAKIGVFAAGAIASQVALGVKSLEELATVTNQTEGALKSTGGVANVTAKEIRTLSEELENLSTVDDKVIQDGANILLTFTQVRNEVGKNNDVFNQAVDAANNISIAMGTDMKSAAVQVGKALNDPIRGIGALRRVGVQLTEQQEKSIKKFVEQGDVLNAQKIILEELETQFGESAEAFGKGPGADMRRFGDAVEGAQQALATGFLPLITKVSEKVQEVLANPKVLRQIRQFGKGAAEGVDDLIDLAGKLPWEAIGDAFRLMGQGTKAALDFFTGLPPWVQTAVLTGWGLNKLTGGALGNIVGELGKGLIKGVLNMNAGVVNVNGKVVNGPGGGAPVGGGRGGRGGGFTGGLLGGLAVGAGSLLAGEATVMGVEFVQNGAKQIEGIQTSLDNLPRKTHDELYDSLDKVRAASAEANKDIVSSVISTKTGLNATLDKTASGIRGQIHTLNMSEGSRAARFVAQQQASTNAVHRLNANEGTRAATAHERLTGIRNTQATSNATLAQIRDKRSSVNVTANVNTTVVLSAAQANQQLQSLRQTVEGGGFI